MLLYDGFLKTKIMKIEFDDKLISEIIQKNIISELKNNNEYKQKVFFIIEKRMDEYFKSENFKILVNDSISKIILNQNLGGVLEKFNENDFNNRFEHIMSRSILNSKLFEQMLSDKMKSFIKIG
jgi:hypothetical protein